MWANALSGPVMVQLFSCDNFDARRISHEIKSMNKDANVVAQVQLLEFYFFHSSPVAVFNYVLHGDNWSITEAT
ncbi:MAG: hypothetical protein IBX43_06860 [Campylobacterales bacterium]|nr:hypothetical protein [Campylobacterales bacterium]